MTFGINTGLNERTTTGQVLTSTCGNNSAAAAAAAVW